MKKLYFLVSKEIQRKIEDSDKNKYLEEVSKMLCSSSDYLRNSLNINHDDLESMHKFVDENETVFLSAGVTEIYKMLYLGNEWEEINGKHSGLLAYKGGVLSEDLTYPNSFSVLYLGFFEKIPSWMEEVTSNLPEFYSSEVEKETVNPDSPPLIFPDAPDPTLIRNRLKAIIDRINKL